MNETIVKGLKNFCEAGAAGCLCPCVHSNRPFRPVESAVSSSRIVRFVWPQVAFPRDAAQFSSIGKRPRCLFLPFRGAKVRIFFHFRKYNSEKIKKVLTLQEDFFSLQKHGLRPQGACATARASARPFPPAVVFFLILNRSFFILNF